MRSSIITVPSWLHFHVIVERKWEMEENHKHTNHARVKTEMLFIHKFVWTRNERTSEWMAVAKLDVEMRAVWELKLIRHQVYHVGRELAAFRGGILCLVYWIMRRTGRYEKFWPTRNAFHVDPSCESRVFNSFFSELWRFLAQTTSKLMDKQFELIIIVRNSRFSWTASNNYQQEDKPHRLELDVGDSLIIIRESSLWYYGYKKKWVLKSTTATKDIKKSLELENWSVNCSPFNGRFNSTFLSLALNRNRALKGIFPKSYVHLIADVEIVKSEYVIKRSEIVDEITTILKEWHDHFKKFFLVSLRLAFTHRNRLKFSLSMTDEQRQSQSDSREDAGVDQAEIADAVGQSSRRRDEGHQT